MKVGESVSGGWTVSVGVNIAGVQGEGSSYGWAVQAGWVL